VRRNVQSNGQFFPGAYDSIRCNLAQFLQAHLGVSGSHSIKVCDEPALGFFNCQPEQNARWLFGQLFKHPFEFGQQFMARGMVSIHHYYNTGVWVAIAAKCAQLCRQLMQQCLITPIRLGKKIARQSASPFVWMQAEISSLLQAEVSCEHLPQYWDIRVPLHQYFQKHQGLPIPK
jgi:hypothetical protein